MAIATPLSWQVIGCLIFCGTIIAIAFLSLASYARVATVSGAVVPDQGVASIVPTRNGVIAFLSVRDGQRVEAGAELATVRAEEDSASGVSAAALLQSAIGQQDANLTAQIASTSASFAAQREQISAQRAGLAGEVTQLRSQMVFQQELIESAAKDYERVRAVAYQGFISKRDLQQREDTLAARRQGLAQLTQSLAAKQAQLRSAERQDAQIAAEARAQIDGLGASRAQVAQQSASAAGARVYALRAPVAGRVTALTARVGQPANPPVPLMTIVPTNAVLRAELAVPSAAIGFVKPGQEVHLAIDAFPYQRFGTIKGKVQTVASSAIIKDSANGATVSVYPVTVTISQPFLIAYGQKETLIAGMTLTARIVTEKQSLFQWLFDPLFAVQRR